VRVCKNGEVVTEGKNVVVTAGFTMLATQLAGGSGPSHMAMGESGTVSTLAMTALQGTEHERVAVSITSSGPVVEFEAVFGSGLAGDVTVREFGIFDAASGGNMLCRFLSASFTGTPSDTITVTWQFEFGEPD
jgi:hypothetical protein